MSLLMANTGNVLHRVLVLEPYDIIWLGIKPIIENAFDNRVALIRLCETNKLADTALRNQVDAILLSVLGHHTDMLLLLQQLSVITRYNQTFQIAAYVRKELPHLEDLLLAFGVNAVFKGPMEGDNVAHYLLSEQREFQPARLTPQEQQIAQSLLAGQSVTRIAQLLCKDIRTISTHKQAVLAKLKMANRGQLQLLGGRLMAGFTA